MIYREKGGIIPPGLKKMPSQRELKRIYTDGKRLCKSAYISYPGDDYFIDYINGEYVLVTMDVFYNSMFGNMVYGEYADETTKPIETVDPKEIEGDTPEEGLHQAGLKPYAEKEDKEYREYLRLKKKYEKIK